MPLSDEKEQLINEEVMILNILFSTKNKGNVENSGFKAAPCETWYAIYILHDATSFSDSFQSQMFI